MQNFSCFVCPDKRTNVAKVYTIFVLIWALDSILQFSLFEYVSGKEHVLSLYLFYIWPNNQRKSCLKFPGYFHLDVKSAMITSIFPKTLHKRPQK